MSEGGWSWFFLDENFAKLARDAGCADFFKSQHKPAPSKQEPIPITERGWPRQRSRRQVVTTMGRQLRWVRNLSQLRELAGWYGGRNESKFSTPTRSELESKQSITQDTAARCDVLRGKRKRLPTTSQRQCNAMQFAGSSGGKLAVICWCLLTGRADIKRSSSSSNRKFSRAGRPRTQNFRILSGLTRL